MGGRLVSSSKKSEPPSISCPSTKSDCAISAGVLRSPESRCAVRARQENRPSQRVAIDQVIALTSASQLRTADCDPRDGSSLKNAAEGCDRRVGWGPTRGTRGDVAGAAFFRGVSPEADPKLRCARESAPRESLSSSERNDVIRAQRQGNDRSDDRSDDRSRERVANSDGRLRPTR
jgi:hypothetical protein